MFMDLFTYLMTDDGYEPFYTTFHSTFYFNKLLKILRCAALVPKFICERQYKTLLRPHPFYSWVLST